MITFSDYPILTEAAWQERIEALAGTPHGTKTEQEIYRELLALVDLTTLEGTDTEARVISLCEKAYGIEDIARGIPKVAAVCVYSPFVKLCKNKLKGKDIRVATVVGGFPSGQLPLKLKLAEINFALNEGADEIDAVISRGKMLEGDYTAVFQEIDLMRAACKKKTLKVILETGELLKPELIRKACEIAIDAQADFLKTSTGKIQPAATEMAAIIMCDTILEYYEKSGIRVGFKAAGGIAQPDIALRYYNIVANILGDKWLNPKLFRIGASRLVDNLLNVIE